MRRISALLIVACIQGCASITGTTNQSVSVQTLERSGNELSGAACEMANNKGKWFVKSPGSVTITRSNDDLQVTCNKDGHEPGRAAVVSKTKGSMFDNILIGGGIGAIVDHNTGAAYEYPSFFQIMMGQTVSINETGVPQASSSEKPQETAAPVAATSVPVSLAPKSVEAASASVPSEVRLRELKRLYDEGLISQQVYGDQQRKILEGTK